MSISELSELHGGYTELDMAFPTPRASYALEELPGGGLIISEWAGVREENLESVVSMNH